MTQSRMNVAIVKIKPGDGIVRARHRGLLGNADGLALRIEGDNPVAAGIAHPVGEDGGAVGAGTGRMEKGREPRAMEKIISQDQARRFAREKLIRNENGLGNAFGLFLLRVGEPEAPLGAVTEERLELRQIGGRRDHENVPDTGEHEHRHRIIDHRLVVDRKKLLRERFGDGMEARRSPPGQQDPTHLPV